VQHGRRVELEIFRTKRRGWGLRTLEPLEAGRFVDTYVGEVVNAKEAARRNDLPHGGRYLFRLDKFAGPDGDVKAEDMLEVDGEWCAGPTRFMNHSCEPNCGIFAVLWNKHDMWKHNLAFFALRKIEKGEELTFDYNPPVERDEESESSQRDSQRDIQREREEDAEECRCGSANCRGSVWL
jgi:[histone H3]-lysine9 N-trimethyltransferase SUV39H